MYLSKKLKEPLEGFFLFAEELVCTLAVALAVDPEAAETWLITDVDCLRFEILLAFCICPTHDIAHPEV